MPAQAQGAAPTNVEVDTIAHTIRLRRVFDAPPSEIFAAWTEPQRVRSWWDPGGTPLAVCEIDLRTGGRFKFVAAGGGGMPFTGTYREVAPPDRLVFEAMGAIGRVILRAATGQTHMVVEIECPTAEHLEQFLKMGIDVGTSQTLDNLVGYVRSRSDV